MKVDIPAKWHNVFSKAKRTIDEEMEAIGKRSPVEVNPDAVPIPEAWGSPKSLDELLRPIPREQPASKQFSKQQTSKQKKKKEEVSVAASLANSAAQDERNSRQGAHYNTPHDSPDNKEDFTIHSAEEARRAIIWGEILQRKY